MIEPNEFAALREMVQKTLHAVPTIIYELSQEVFDLQRFYDSPGSECETNDYLVENEKAPIKEIPI